MDLIEPEVAAEKVEALPELTAERRGGEVLHLVRLRVDPPAGRVGVTPFRAHRHLVGAKAAAREPGGQERLGPSVRARCVEVPDAGAVRAVEHLVRVSLHLADAGVAAEIVGVPDVDVAGPPERGQPQP